MKPIEPHLLDVEEMEGRWIAHAPQLPGCFSSAARLDDALAAATSAIAAYRHWRRSHGDNTPDALTRTEVREIHRAFQATPDYEVNAFFASDRAPLTADEIALWLKLLAWSRADLLQAADVGSEVLRRPVEGDWSVLGILNHVGRAENWYLDRLGLALPQVPDETFARLEAVRARLNQVMPDLAGDARLAVPDSETWSARKLLRRALWHERDHTTHILQFRRRLG